MTSRTRPSRPVLTAVGSLLLLVLLTTVAACSSDDDSAGSADRGVAGADVATGGGPAEAPVPAAPGDLSGAEAESSDGSVMASDAGAKSVRLQDAPETQQAAIIKTAKIVLRDKDVGRARLDLLDVSDAVGGQIADEQSSNDEDGRVSATRLVLRVPTAKFEDALEQIGDIGDQVASEVHADDVTTQIVDIAARLKVQRASVDRITALLDRAQSIRDIVAIEGQLSQRTAALESLEQQQAYLADQTSLSTITVRVEKTAAEVSAANIEPGRAEASYHGFVGGLAAGWSALGHFGNGVAILTGALLPWLVVALLLGVPALVLVRRLRGRRTTPSADVTT